MCSRVYGCCDGVYVLILIYVYMGGVVGWGGVC